MSSLTIRPLNTGLIGPSSSLYYYDTLHRIYNPPAFMVGIPCFAFLVEGGDKPLLVDTGISDPKHASQYHNSKESWPSDMTIMDQLKRVGYQPEDIGYVVLSHLHWDHCYFMNRFTKARFFVHPKEIEFSRDPLPPFLLPYEHPITGLRPPAEGLNLEPVTQGVEIIPGVSVLETPGHSMGDITVCVNAQSGEYLCVGDAIMHMDNIKEVKEMHYTVSPPGRFLNMIECYRSLELLKNRAKSPDFLLASHDKGLLDRIQTTPVLS